MIVEQERSPGMFFRVKRAGPYRYLLLVQSRREEGRVVQHVLANLGRLDELVTEGSAGTLLRSLTRCVEEGGAAGGARAAQLERGDVRSVGPELVLSRLWQAVGLPELVSEPSPEGQD